MVTGLRNFTDRVGDGAGKPLLHTENGEELIHVQSGVAIVLGSRPPESSVTLYTSSKKVVWLSDVERERGYAVDFLSISLHAVSRDPEAYFAPCVYIQIETEEDSDSDSDSDSDTEINVTLDLSKITEMRLIPSDPNQLDELFDIFCQCAELNPDPDQDHDDEEDEHNWGFGGAEMDEDDDEDPEWLANPIGQSNEDHDLSRSVLELQIEDQRFEDAEETISGEGRGPN